MSQPRATGMGSIPLEGRTAFRVWAPNAERVVVTGSFNEWSTDRDVLEREGGGHWYGEVEGAGPGDEYKYVITTNGEQFHRIDPRARAVTNSVGNGIIYDPNAFDWEGDSFTIPTHNELVIYETHIGSFVAEEGDPGDIATMASRLGYLKSLGINAIELMPVAEFAGDYSWGYNPAHPSPSSRATAGRTTSRSSSARRTNTASRSSSTSSSTTSARVTCPCGGSTATRRTTRAGSTSTRTTGRRRRGATHARTTAVRRSASTAGTTPACGSRSTTWTGCASTPPSTSTP